MPKKILNITKGLNNKPVATEALQDSIQRIPSLSGEFFFGYPLIATPDGKYSIDATLVSPEKGLVLFDLVEGATLGDYAGRQDDIFNKIEARLKLHRELMIGRHLKVPVSVVTFAPAIANIDQLAVDGYPLANETSIVEVLNEFAWTVADESAFAMLLSAIESLSSIRKSRSKREVVKANSRGARLRDLENSIATLDHRQNRAVIDTVEGVQRIRGLAGSGKTIVLALKAAYLHTQFPSWRIAVTFNTRSLKGQFKRHINNFCIEQSGEEPDWTKIRVVNAWGAPGGDERDGIYYEFCRATGHQFSDFRNASYKYGGNERAFDGACKAALDFASPPTELYDAILVDEAQDFSPAFLKLCYRMLKQPKRLVYAYDELQNLSGNSLPPPEEIFGVDDYGKPIVTFAGDDNRRDVILQKCYRNSKPVLVAAHALGFGIYRQTPANAATGLVQMFEQPTLWKEIGYRVSDGELSKDSWVALERTDETSPPFLAAHSSPEDLVVFKKFDNEADLSDWLTKEIQRNIAEEELRHDDIIVIHPDPMSARERVGPIRKSLFDLGIQNHLAGVDTNADIFFRNEIPSVTFTGIYRAKGNEAGMVYVINAQDCVGMGSGLATLRNRLFTAITRSKAWVRVLGHGDKMDALMQEYQTLLEKKHRLEFVYPNDEILGKLRVLHRDLSPQERAKREQKKTQAKDLAAALERGELNPDDLDDQTKEQLLKLLGGRQ